MMSEEKFNDKIREYNSYYYILNPIFRPGLETFKEENPGKEIVIVLYTGGVDSTYSLLRELEKGNLVIPVYNRLNCECEKGKFSLIEYTLIHNVKMLRSKYSNLESLQLNVSSQTHLSSSFVYYQQVYNVISIFAIGYDILQYVDNVIMSIVMGDDSVSYLSELRSIFNTSMKMMSIDDKPLKVSLKFPLVKTNKHRVHSRLKDLMKKTDVNIKLISCENPKVLSKLNRKGDLEIEICPCERCNSCIHNREKDIELGSIKMIAQKVTKTEKRKV